MNRQQKQGNGLIWDGAVAFKDISLLLLNPWYRWKAVYALVKLTYKYNTVVRVKNVSDSVKQLATFAWSAYELKEQRPAELYGYEYIIELSTFNTAVYRSFSNSTGGKPSYIVAEKGTNSSSEFIPDLSIALAGLTSSHSWALALKEVIKKLDGDILLVGHSLGGALSAVVADEFNLPVETFNLGSTVIGTSDCKKCQHHIIAGDVISNTAMSNLKGEKIILYDIQKPNLSAHTIQQFL